MNPEHASLIEQFEKSTATFAAACNDVPAGLLDRSPAPGKWSIRQIVVHVADSEFVTAMRFRLIIAEPGSQLSPYDQDKWSAQTVYEKQSFETALEAFLAVRRANVEMVRLLPDAVWQQSAMHLERGETSLEKLIAHMTKHTDNHSGQIIKIREQFAQE